MNSAVWSAPEANAGIGHQAVGGGDDVAGAQRGVEREIDRRQSGRASAVAGAVGAQRLAIGEGVFAVGIALAIARGRAVDVAAVKHLGDARRAERLAGLNRRGVAAHGQRKILAVAASHAEGRSGTRDARRRRRLGWLIEAERIGEEVRLRGACRAAVSGRRRTGNRTDPRRRRCRAPAQASPQGSRRPQTSRGAARAKKPTLYATPTPPNATQRAEALEASVRVTLTGDGK